MIEIRVEFPPNIDIIRETFPLTGQEIFAWNPIIYSPTPDLPQWLIDHEKVHFEQQGDHIEDWWDRYINDVAFRLRQEIPAHIQELKTFKRLHKDGNVVIRKRIELAKRLSGPLYGKLISMSGAMEYLK